MTNSVYQCSSNKMVKAKAYVLNKQFSGFPKQSDFKIVEEDLPQLKDGEFLVEAVYLSVDPYMRAYAPRLELGTTFIGGQVARIIESRNEKFPAGKNVYGNFGWRTLTVTDGIKDSNVYLLPDAQGLPLSVFLGVLGMPGNTAYFGFLEICQPKAGEIVVVTGAAGAVGSHVGQIAKIKGCTVIGVAGSEEKGRWLVDELNFDHFINYKDKDFEKQLENFTPKGVDCYFDNVGGEISSIILRRMNTFGRISICGAISGYNATSAPTATIIQSPIFIKQLTLEGFVVTRWLDRWLEGIQQNLKWVQEGKLKYGETVTEGFEHMPQGFIDMLNGVNVGKAVIKV